LAELDLTQDDLAAAVAWARAPALAAAMVNESAAAYQVTPAKSKKAAAKKAKPKA
jgi:hypothetical protein